MLEALQQGLHLIASVENILALFGGMLGGVIIGALPGLTGAMAVTLALPFTFYMPPVTSLMLLLGIYKGSMYGGSISAILIRTPGTAAAACTVLDGYPLARQGKAGQALYMALYASCFADMVSNLALIFCTGMIASFALRFGPAEFFSLICFSLTIVAGLSGSSLLKGFVSACFGLLLASVGMDIVFGTGRMTFGDVNLMAGFSFIPLLIGLFAIPEIIRATSPKPRPVIQADMGQRRLKWADFKRCFTSICRGSLIGVVMGAIPGIGGAPAAYLSYSEARRYSKRSANFGKGELEGVAAAEAGNNGVCGATLIPLLSLGVPGDIITAIMLGALMIQGLTPGPLLFVEHPVTVYGIFAAFIIANVMMLVCGLIAVRGANKITSIPGGVLMPIVVTLCVVGGYAVNNSTFDLLVVAIFGTVGYLMIKCDFPLPPLLLAMILEPIAESNFRRALSISQNDYAIFYTSPVACIILGLSLFVLIKSVWDDLRAARKNPSKS